ncbi:MAG TPA: transglutaminase-like domain-containing protein [Acidimicrobiales bacterium]
MDPAAAAARFARLVRQEQRAVPLDEAALLLAAHATPGLEVAAELARLDAIAAGCPGPTLDHLLPYLFEDLGFRGDRDTYEDPRNSFLNEVMARRRGIPISLSVLTMEVGRRIGVPVQGVGMPGHFLLRDRVDHEVFVDPFHGGRLLDRQGCERLFRSLHGPGAPWDEAWLAPVGPRAILARMLANLAAVYRASGARGALVEVLRLRAAIPGVEPDARAALASALAATGRFDLAAGELERLADDLEGADPERASEHRVAAVRARARLN